MAYFQYQQCDVDRAYTSGYEKGKLEAEKRTKGIDSFREMPRETKCFIVFRGQPTVFYLDADQAAGELEIDVARDYAVSIVESTGDDATYMLVPKESVEMGIVFHQHGIAGHSIEEARKADWPKDD